MEGLIIGIFGGMVMFAAGAVFGATRTNKAKTLVYSLSVFVVGFVALIVSGNVLRIYDGEVGGSGEVFGVLFFGGFFCMSSGIGAVIAGSVRLIVIENSHNLLRRQTSEATREEKRVE